MIEKRNNPETAGVSAGNSSTEDEELKPSKVLLIRTQHHMYGTEDASRGLCHGPDRGNYDNETQGLKSEVLAFITPKANHCVHKATPRFDKYTTERVFCRRRTPLRGCVKWCWDHIWREAFRILTRAMVGEPHENLASMMVQPKLGTHAFGVRQTDSQSSYSER